MRANILILALCLPAYIFLTTRLLQRVQDAEQLATKQDAELLEAIRESNRLMHELNTKLTLP